MKNYPNQASTFARIRAALEVINELNGNGQDATRDEVLGYACAERGVYTFAEFRSATPTPAQLKQRIVAEKAKPRSNRGAETFARELRRTLRDMNWIDAQAGLTARGTAVLASQPVGIEEQSLLVEGLLNIQAADKDGSNPHHPVQTMLALLADSPSLHREGLELALEPRNDSPQELKRVLALYRVPRQQRMTSLGITPTQRANAVKIFPTLAVTAGLVVEDEDGYFSLSQDGWRVLGQTPTSAKNTIAKRRGRRRTVGRLVTVKTVAARRNTKPPRTLSAEEQARAAEKLRERTADHQKLVKRTTALIGDGRGTLFEDEFSYDLLWVPTSTTAPAYLFEMKTVTGENDAYTRARHAVGQLSYYDYFHAAPTLGGRKVVRVAVFDAPLPQPLAEYLSHDRIGALVYPEGGQAASVNAIGARVLKAIKSP